MSKQRAAAHTQVKKAKIGSSAEGGSPDRVKTVEGRGGSHEKVKALGRGGGGSQEKDKHLGGSSGKGKSTDTQDNNHEKVKTLPGEVGHQDTTKILGGEKGDGIIRMVKPKPKSFPYSSPASSDDDLDAIGKNVKKKEVDYLSHSEKSSKGKGGGGGLRGSTNEAETINAKRQSKQKKSDQPVMANTRESFINHKSHLQHSIKELDMVLSTELSEQKLKSESDHHTSHTSTKATPPVTKKPEEHIVSHRKPSFPRGSHENDDTLEQKRYVEEDVDYEQLQEKLRAQECEKCNEWISKAIDTVLLNTAILVLVAALMTAFGCYIFVQLPKSIYSTHILYEVFLVYDSLMKRNHFSRGFGIRWLTPLPAVIILMYITILYFIYIVQYPKQTLWVVYLRYAVVTGVEIYLVITALCYGINIGHVPSRLDVFFKHDMKGIMHHFHKGEPSEKLHFLNRTQEYFGCCGYQDAEEWQDAYPNIFNKNLTPTWPISCCDEKRSGVACYGPVEKMVTYYRRNNEDDDNPDMVVMHTKPRLHEDTCRKKEEVLCITVISLICLLTVAYVIISTWNVALLIKMTHLVTTKDLVLKEKEKYIDFF